MSVIGLGQQINLDKGEGQIVNGKWIDDIRALGPELVIEFISPRKLYFTDTADTYITYKNIDWVPVNFGQIESSDNGWTYNMHCYPKQIHVPIYQPCLNTLALASAMGVTLSSYSQVLDIDFPVINIYSGFLINEVRKQSMNKAAKNGDLGNAYFIYLDGNNLHTLTWKKVLQSNAQSLKTEIPGLEGTDILKYVQARIATDSCAIQHPKVFNYNSFLYRMIEKKFDHFSTQPLLFGSMYTIRFSDTSELDESNKFMCIRSSFDFTSANGYTNTLAHISLEI